MTVQKDVTKNIYVGNGSTRTFPFTFECPAEHPEYIKVYLMQDDGTALATSDYQLDMDARQITYPSSGTALPEGKKLVIMRELPLQQQMNLVNNGPYFAEDIEQAFDENVMAMQQIAEKLNRTITMSVDVDGSAFINEVPFEAGKSFRIADDGKSIVLTEDPARVLPLAQSKLEAATAQANIAAAKAAAAAESESKAESYAANADASKTAAAASSSDAANSAAVAAGYKADTLLMKNAVAENVKAAKESEANAKQASVSASASEAEAKAAKVAANEAAVNASNSASEAKLYETGANSYAGNAKEYAATATAQASKATAKAIEATDGANRAKSEADRAKSISDSIGNPVSDVTENNGTVTVTKSNGTQSTFMAFPQDANGTLPIAKGGTGANNAYDAAENLNLGYKQFTIKANPSYAYIPSLFTCTYTSVTLPKGIELNINGEAYISTVETTLLISTLGTAAELAGKDVYIYACQGEGTEPVFTLSLNSTVPDGYTADNSRKIGGFHCECSAVGSLTNVNPVTGVTEAHKLIDLGTGEIIAPSRWDLWHKPTGKQTEGMSYIEEVDVWIGIYGASWDGTKLVHTFGGIWADGTSTKKWHGELSLEALMQQGMRLPWRYEFQMAAKGSNEQTNIKGSADPSTTGAHVDTAGRRMVSNYGLEDCCGVLWQWLMDLGFAGGSGWTNSTYASDVDPRSYGQTYSTLYRLHGGGGWYDPSSCGSRCAACNSLSANVSSSIGCRGASEPLHRKGEKRRPVY